jgi:hypothetical protein
LEATRYFQPGAWFHRDPFANAKRGELEPDQGPQRLRVVLENLPARPPVIQGPPRRGAPFVEVETTEQTSEVSETSEVLAGTFSALLHASLWGNRADLSYKQVMQDTRGPLALERERANLLVDDTARVWQFLQTPRGGRIDLICDNAGTELLFDLALADFLLSSGLADQVVFHLKPQPFFVSDAMIADVRASLDALARSSASALNQLAARLERALTTPIKIYPGLLAEKRWVLSEHPFWVTSSFFFEMPEDLQATLAQARLVILKGDANYRRLIGDCHWQPTMPFESIVDYFPAPLVSLRTLKAELIVGLREGEAERLQAEDPAWLVNGKRGVVQARL